MLLADADANYCYTMGDIGARGGQSDGGIFRLSSIGQQLDRNNLHVPKTDKIGNNRLLPYTLVGNEAFQLTNYMLRPYPGRGTSELNATKRIFNYRFS